MVASIGEEQVKLGTPPAPAHKARYHLWIQIKLTQRSGAALFVGPAPFPGAGATQHLVVFPLDPPYPWG